MNFQKLRTLIVEDEEVPKNELIQALEESEEFIVQGTAGSIDDAYDLIRNTPSDILFLDIKLEGGLCFTLLKRLKNDQITIPLTVINTGFRDYEFAKKIHNDYSETIIYILNKPFWENWIHQKDIILEEYFKSKRKEKTGNDTLSKTELIPIYTNRKSIMMRPEDIILIKTGEKTKGNTEIHLEKKVLHCPSSLVQFLQFLPTNFIQINRFEIINVSWISYVEHADKEVYLRNGYSTTIGTTYYKSICDWLGIV